MANLKELFPEFYQDKLDNSDLKDNHNNIIVLDTNYLLDIVQLPTSVAKKYIEALEKVKSNIYVPYLVALEFNFRKSTIKKEKRHKIRKYKDDIDNSISNIKEKLNKIDLINIEEDKENFTKELLTLTDEYSKKLQKIVDQKIQDNITSEEEDLYSRLIEIIEEKVGEKYDQGWISAIEAEGEERYSKGLPPGFDDQNKDEEEDAVRIYGDIQYERKYGDLIIWKDIIRYSKSSLDFGKKLVFVTNDGQAKKKKDLLHKVKGLVVGPNIYLMNELQREAEKEFYILSNLRFLQLVSDLSDAQIKELKSISETKYRVKISEDRREEFIEQLMEVNNNDRDNEYGVTDDGYLFVQKKGKFYDEKMEQFGVKAEGLDAREDRNRYRYRTIKEYGKDDMNYYPRKAREEDLDFSYRKSKEYNKDNMDYYPRKVREEDVDSSYRTIKEYDKDNMNYYPRKVREEDVDSSYRTIKEYDKDNMNYYPRKVREEDVDSRYRKSKEYDKDNTNYYPRKAREEDEDSR